MGSNATGFEVMRGRAGEVYQAGIPSRVMGENDTGLTTEGRITPAVVVAAYYADEDDRAPWFTANQRSILCDVRTLGPYSRTLTKVPVLQHTQGLWDEDIYIPRAARVDINGGELSTGTASTKDQTPPTPAEQVDGDHVLIGFLDNNPKTPVVLPFTLGHPKSTAPKKADGRRRRIRHNGVLVEWDKDGNFTVDATGAAKPDLDKSGKEQSNSGTAGKIKIKTKDGSGAESSLYLDELGGIKFTDGGADFIEFTKAGKLIAVNAGTKITVQAGASYELTAPSVKVTAAASIEETSAVVTVTSPLITLGSSAAVPMIKAPPDWIVAWSALAGIVATQETTYKGPPPPPIVLVADYLALLTALKTLTQGFPTALCIMVKGT